MMHFFPAGPQKGFTTKRAERQVRVIASLPEARAESEPVRGFTLLIAVILTSVLVSIGLALLDVSYKDVVLSSTAKQSNYAFYQADSTIECALYWDSTVNAFDYSSPLSASSMKCGTLPLISYTSSQSPAPFGSGNIRTTTFDIPCKPDGTGGTSGSITIVKTDPTGVCDSAGHKSCLYATGYNICDATSDKRLERGLKVTY